MKNISKALNVVGILVFVIAFLMKGYDVTRLTLVTLGIVILIISYVSKKKRSYLSSVIYALIWLVLLYSVDTLVVYFANTKPIFASEIVSSKKFKTYDSLIYREFECNNKTYFDLFYKKNNYCDFSLLEEKDINTLSSDIVNNFNDYRDKFYIINAKISNKEGNNKVEFKSYNNDEESINGNAVFNDNIIYSCEINDDNIDSLKVFDNIKIVGRISKLKKDGDVYNIIIKDANIYDVTNYDNFKINVVNNKSCEKDKTEYVSINNYNYYTSCLSNIYVVYDSDVYELSYVLKDEKITLNDLLKDYEAKEEKTLEEKTYYLYKFKDYNILECDSNNIIIGNDKLTLDNNYCSTKKPDLNDL